MRTKLSLLVTLAITASALFIACPGPQGAKGARESLKDHVLKSGKINCSYAVYPPYCIKDPNTGEMSGIFVEVMNEIGEKLGLEINWTEEVGWGTIFEGLESGRHDMFAAGLWQSAVRAKAGYFSKPLFYNGIRIWVRADETRIRSLDDINSPSIRVAVQDGAVDEAIASADFPKAKRVSIPQMNPWSDNLLNIQAGKADVSFTDTPPVAEFLEKNPGSLKEVDVGRALRYYATSYAFRSGEDEFKAMIDATIDELASEGVIERILRKYERTPGELLRVAPSYTMP